MRKWSRQNACFAASRAVWVPGLRLGWTKEGRGALTGVKNRLAGRARLARLYPFTMCGLRHGDLLPLRTAGGVELELVCRQRAGERGARSGRRDWAFASRKLKLEGARSSRRIG